MRAIIQGQSAPRKKARGSRHGRTSLDEVDVAYIKRSNRTCRELAEMFHTVHSRICDIRNGVTWLEVEPQE